MNANLDEVPALRNLQPILNNHNTDNLRIKHRNRCKETEEVKKRWDLIGHLKITLITNKARFFQAEILARKFLQNPVLK